MSENSIEFWPDYSSGPLWGADGRDVTTNLGLSQQLVDALRLWNGEYDEKRLPVEPNGEGDAEWLQRGRVLLLRVRQELPERDVIVTEPWWGVPDVDPNELR